MLRKVTWCAFERFHLRHEGSAFLIVLGVAFAAARSLSVVSHRCKRRFSLLVSFVGSAFLIVMGVAAAAVMSLSVVPPLAHLLN